MNEARKIDPAVATELASAMERARRGDFVGARAIAERALAVGGDLAEIHGLLGMLCCQMGDLTAGMAHLRAAVRVDPGDVASLANLVTALIQSDASGEALHLCTTEAAERDPSCRLWRLRAYLLQIEGDFAGAVEGYRRVVEAAADDFEGWNNLGNACAAIGDAEGSIAALQRAVALRPNIAPVRLNLATTLLELGRFDEAIEVLTACTRDFPRDPKPFSELAALLKTLYRDPEALVALQQAAALDPRDVELQVSLGIELFLAWKTNDAEKAFRNAIAIQPDHAKAYVHLAVLFDRANRADEFPAHIAEASAARIDEGSLQLIRALACRRERRFEEGLAALARVPDDVEPLHRAQLAGQFHDRLGNPEAAFSAFSEMNRQASLDESQPRERAAELRRTLDRNRAIVTREWYAGWNAVLPPKDRASPVFLVGFPRSGTTLLDTLLMGHPQVQVLEERPMLTRVEAALGGIDRLTDLDDETAATLRALYFREVAENIDLRPDTLLIDKNPLHLNKVPLIHRLFPDARFILALRHPLDVVLSCFITNFRLNDAMANFVDLETSAAFYDLNFSFWEQSRAIMPIRVHEIVYERIVADSEAELRPLFDYLDLDWRGEVLDHRRTAMERGVITTASYSQVTEPIYNRAAGRWTRYRDQLAPVIPILRPWIEQFGYAL